jgi:hypothetical protein
VLDLADELLASLPAPDGGLEVDSEEGLREVERRARPALVSTMRHRPVIGIRIVSPHAAQAR